MIQATFSGFNTALTSLRANQAQLSIIGQNLSNMNTEGYTRQALKVNSVNYSNPDFFSDSHNTNIGYGVTMSDVYQIRDQFLDIQYRDQKTKVNYNQSVSDSLNSLDDNLDETKLEGLSTSFNNIQTALTNMQDPSKVNDPVYEGELRSRMNATAVQFNDAAARITTSMKDEYTKLDGSGSSENGDVDKVNQLLANIGDLNIKIKRNQLMGNKVLELQDQRNQMIDELSGYIPIEVTYYTDKYEYTDTSGHTVTRDRGLNYDANGNPTGKSGWPTDLKIDLVYSKTDNTGATTQEKVTLVNGSAFGKTADGSPISNYGSIGIKINGTELAYDGNGKRNISYDGSYTNGLPQDVEIVFKPAANTLTLSTADMATGTSLQSAVDRKAVTTDNRVTTSDNTLVRLKGGSIQAHLDMLTDNYSSQNNGSIYRSLDYYMKRLDNLASTFATDMNAWNNKGVNGYSGATTGSKQYMLLVNSDATTATADSETGITAANIAVSQKWVNGTVHIGTSPDPDHGSSSTDTILNMLSSVESTHAALDGKTYSNEMDSIATYIANDSYNNKNELTANNTVLSSIATSKDQQAGVSLDEEAANMMTYVTSYNAAARLMNAIDETLQSLLGIAG